MTIRDRIIKLIGQEVLVQIEYGGIWITQGFSLDCPKIVEVEEDYFVLSNGWVYSINAVFLIRHA